MTGRAPPPHVERPFVERRAHVVVGGQDLLDALGHERVLRDEDIRAARDLGKPLGRSRTASKAERKDSTVWQCSSNILVW